MRSKWARHTPESFVGQNGLLIMRNLLVALAGFGALILGGCASFESTASRGQPAAVAPIDSAAPALAWQAPLPHGGDLGAMADWWQRHGDPVLTELIEVAQGASASLAQAMSRIESARASQVAADAALGPRLDATASAVRNSGQAGAPAATALAAGLQASWEMDLFGGNRLASDAALAQLQGSQALWHDARVSVAAEVANLYYSLRTCHQLLDVTRADAKSRAETSRLAAIGVSAGFTAPATAALARASAAEGSSRITQQQAQCDLYVKSLVAITALSETALKEKVALALSQSAQAAPFVVATVPAQTIAQRPDVFAAERDVVAASAQVGTSRARQYPRLSLNGSIGALRYSAGGNSSDQATWSIGPFALSLPLFDGGQRSANIDAALARYDEAVAIYTSKVRQAVREVEQALVNLQSANARMADAEVATQGYGESLAAVQARYANGLASLTELEEARRVSFSAQLGLEGLQLERNLAWVALYRALGGGWSGDVTTPPRVPVVAPAS